MDASRLEEFCRAGERADTFLRQGRPSDALKTYQEMVVGLEKSKQVDSYLLAKLTLGVLRCHVKMGDFKNAFRVWNSNLEDGFFGIGIYALESAQTTVHDMITYDMLCAFLHTLADSEPHAAARAVNQYCSRVCEHAIEEVDRQTLKLALNNWKQHLKEIFTGAIPHQYAVSLIEFEKKLGEPVKHEPIDFPLPTPWEKPHDFREMSRVVLMNASPHAKPSAQNKKRRVAG